MRKKYSGQFGSPGKDEGPPVTTAPTQAAKLPEPVADAKPPEPIETESPADKAAKTALQQRLAEMQNAETLTREAVQHPQFAAEPQPEPQQPTLEDMVAHLPPRVQRWYRQHPEFASDPEKAAQIQYCHHVARRETGQEFTDPYFDRMEQMLGLAPTTNGQSRPQPQPQPQLQPRNAEAPRARVSAASVSAPPTREVPSMASGRSQSFRASLTADELEIARSCGQTPEQYQAQKEKWARMKAEGAQ